MIDDVQLDIDKFEKDSTEEEKEFIVSKNTYSSNSMGEYQEQHLKNVLTFHNEEINSNNLHDNYNINIIGDKKTTDRENSCDTSNNLLSSKTIEMSNIKLIDKPSEKFINLINKFAKKSISDLILNNQFNNKIKSDLNLINNKKENPTNNQDFESELTEEFLQEMRDKVQISQARGKVYNQFFQRDEANVEFNYFYYIKFLFYHFLFFFVLGPLTGLILLPIEGYNKLRNMGFIGISTFYFVQLFIFIAGGPNLLITIYFKFYHIHEGKLGGLLDNLEISEMFFCVLSVIIRCIIIAIRYGYTSKTSMLMRYEPVIPDTYRDYILSGWRDVDSKTIDIEILNSIIRLQIDADLFMFNIFSNIDKSWIERFSNDDYHDDNISSGKDLKSTFDVIKHYEKMDNNVKDKIQKMPIDYREYSKLAPLFAKLKREFKFFKKYQKFGQIKMFKNFFKKTTNLYNENSVKNEKLQNKSESYKLIIKKIAKQFKTETSENLMSKLVFGYEHNNDKENFLLPQHKKFSVKLFNFDFPGRIYMRELYLFSRFESKNLFTKFVYFILFVRIFMPQIYRLANNKPPFGNTYLEVILTIINSFSTFLVFFLSVIFIEIGGNDYKRRSFCLKGLSAMLNPDKFTIKSPFKFIPTLNIFNHQNLKSWLFLRRLTMDVGLRYVKRIELYASSFLFTYIIILCTLTLGFFEYIKGFTYKTYPLLFILGYIDTSIIILMLYRMVVIGVKLNEFYDIHKHELNFIKTNFKYIILNFEIWKEMKIYNNNYLKAAKDFYNISLEYHKFNDEMIKEEDKLNGKNIPQNDEEFIENLKIVIETLDDTIVNLEMEKESHPVKLLGFTLTSDLVNQFYATCFTLVYAFGQYFITS